MTGYDWQADDEDTFRKWLMPSVLTFNSNAMFADLAKATNDFTEIEFGFTVNGIAVNADKFLERLQEVIHDEAGREAARLVKQNDELNAVQEALNDLTEAAREAIIRAVSGTPLEQHLPSDADGWWG